MHEGLGCDLPVLPQLVDVQLEAQVVGPTEQERRNKRHG